MTRAVFTLPCVEYTKSAVYGLRRMKGGRAKRGRGTGVEKEQAVEKGRTVKGAHAKGKGEGRREGERREERRRRHRVVSSSARLGAEELGGAVAAFNT